MNDHEDMIDVFERRLMKFDGHELGVGVVEDEVVCTYYDTTQEMNEREDGVQQKLWTWLDAAQR